MNEFTVYHKDYCPYCRAARKLLQSLGWKYRLIDVSNDADAFNEMTTRSRRRTVPQIFQGDKHIGGSDDFRDYVKALGKFK